MFVQFKSISRTRRALPFVMLWVTGLLIFVLPSPVCAQTPPAHTVSASTTSPAAMLLPPRDPYTPRVPERAILYQRSAYALGLAGIGWHILGLWLLLRSGASARLRNGVYRLIGRGRSAVHPVCGKAPPFRAVLLYGGVYLGFMRCWALPIGLTDLMLERHFGFGHESVGAFLQDDARGLLFDAVLVPLVWGIYTLRARFTRRWWLIVWALLLPLLCLQSVVEPVVVAPLYNHFTPLPPGPLRDEMLALAVRAGITNARVFVADTSRRTTHVNAYVTGIGPSTRIVIEDTALHTLPDDQLRAMLGHEMGHYIEGHIWITLLSGGLGAGALLWLLAQLLPRLAYRVRRRYGLHGAWDLAALPLLSLTLYLLIQAQLPLANALSRYLEHRADRFGLQTTELNDATARLFVGFAERDFSDPNPPLLLHLWWGTHPTLAERIAYARHFSSTENTK